MPNPQTFDNLSNVKFKFEIARIPNVNYWVQSALLPSMSIEGGILPGMRGDVPIPGSKILFENMTINFIVDQQLANYEEMYKWMMDIQTAKTVAQMVSDCSFHFLDGNNNITRTMILTGAYPTVITELSLNSDDSDILPVTCSVTFNYAYFKFADRDYNDYL